jgi:hypothetical protein
MEEGFVQPRSGYFSAAGTCELRLRPAWVAGAWEGPLADACEPHKLKPSQSIGVGLWVVALVEDADGGGDRGRASVAEGRRREWEVLGMGGSGGASGEGDREGAPRGGDG